MRQIRRGYSWFVLNIQGFKWQSVWQPCWCTQQKNVITTLLLLYTNMVAMTSHANQELILIVGIEREPTISDNNIGQWLPFPPYPLPSVVLQVQKNIERKVDIIVATLKEGKRGRAFVWGWPETFGWDCRFGLHPVISSTVLFMCNF